jgi:hypothetical protein
MEFLIDPTGRSRRGENRNIPAAVTLTGCVYVRTVDRPSHCGADHRTVIVTLQPSLVSDPAIISTGNKLAALRPNRIVLIAEGSDTKCFVLSDSVLALRTINALAHGNGAGLVAQPLNAPGRPI